MTGIWYIADGQYPVLDRAPAPEPFALHEPYPTWAWRLVTHYAPYPVLAPLEGSMQFPSQAYKDAASAAVRESKIVGSITLTGGGSISINDDNIGSLYKTNTISTDDIPRPGSATAAELGFDLYINSELEPELLAGARVVLSYYLKVTGHWYEIPLGAFTVINPETKSKCCVHITALDDMIKLKDTSVSSLSTSQYSIYGWLMAICRASGLQLGISEYVVNSLPNGREFVLWGAWTESDTLATAWDMVQNFAQIMNCAAYIDRWGKLNFAFLGGTDCIRAISAVECDRRAISRALYKVSRITTTMTYTVGSRHELQVITAGSSGSGITLDLPENRTFSSYSASSLEQFMDNILESMVEYHPAEIDIFGDPALEIGDKIMITDITGQSEFIIPITSYRWQYRGTHTIKACGAEAAAGIVKTYAGKSATETKKQAFDCGAHAETAERLETPREISLVGDVSGSVDFGGSDDVEITVTVEDNSHNHVITNVNGLQGALDGKSDDGHTHDLSAMITGLTVGTGDIVSENMYVITQMADGSTNTYYRRSISKLWNYIQSKTNALYLPKNNSGTRLSPTSENHVDLNELLEGRYYFDSSTISNYVDNKPQGIGSGFILDAYKTGANYYAQRLYVGGATGPRIWHRALTKNADTGVVTASEWYRLAEWTMVPPDSMTSDGYPGITSFDSDFLYLCYASGDWRKIPLTKPTILSKSPTRLNVSGWYRAFSIDSLSEAGTALLSLYQAYNSNTPESHQLSIAWSSASANSMLLRCNVLSSSIAKTSINYLTKIRLVKKSTNPHNSNAYIDVYYTQPSASHANYLSAQISNYGQVKHTNATENDCTFTAENFTRLDDGGENQVVGIPDGYSAVEYEIVVIPPASSSSRGTKGTVLTDANRIYVCTDNGTWKCANLSTF